MEHHRPMPLKGIAAACLIATTFGSAALAQDANFPTRAVTIIVPANPGGTGDIVARALGEKLSKEWRQPVMIENRPGAGGEIGTTALLGKPADGYTLILSTGQLAILPAMSPDIDFSMKDDLQVVNVVSRLPYVLGASGDPKLNNPKTFAALVEAARAAPEAITYASGGTGSASHLVIEQMAAELGVKFLHVPYQGSGGEAMVDVMAGRVDFTVSSVPEIIGFFGNNQMIPLAAMSEERLPSLPDVETVSTTIPGFTGGNWIGLAGRRGIPEAVLEKINADIAKVAAEDDMKAMWEKQLMVPENMSVAEADTFFKAEIERWAVTVEALGGPKELKK